MVKYKEEKLNSSIMLKKPPLYRTKPGTSLLVGLGLTTIIVLVSLGVTTTVVSSIRESANVTGANQAYYAAEGALEKGLLENQKHGAGYSGAAQLENMNWGCVGGNTTVGKDTTTMTTTAPMTTMDGTAGSSLCGGPKQKASYTISGQVPDETKYNAHEYGIPRPGTGNVGENCDSLKPVVKGVWWWGSVSHKFYTGDNPNVTDQWQIDAKDHPCNWNKIRVGETVSIPLYVTKADPNVPGATTNENIFKAGSTFSLNLKTGCLEGDFCYPAPLLETGKGDPKYKYLSKYDDPIATWQIIGESEDGEKTYVFGPYNSFDKLTGWKDKTNIFYKSKINSDMGANILSESGIGVDADGCRGQIKKILTGTGSGDACSDEWDKNIKKPVLKLSIIHSLELQGGGKIPYLQYQLITNDVLNLAPTDSAQTVTAEGYSGTFKQVLEVKNPQETGLVEYVIQQ